jgi:hypothetical protein
MKMIVKSLLALGLAAGLTAASFDDAQARRGHHHHHGHGIGVGAGIAGAIIGLGVLGAYSSRGHAYSRACYDREHCGNVGRRCWENRYGETVCKGGEYRCWTKTYCN